MHETEHKTKTQNVLQSFWVVNTSASESAESLSRLCWNYRLCLIISEQLTFHPAYVNSSAYHTGSVKQPEGTELGSDVESGAKKASRDCKWSKMFHNLERSPLPDTPHLIIQTAEFWRACGEERRAAFLTTGAAENGVGSILSSPPPPPPPWALSPILISRGASWRGSRTAVHLAARRLFISSASPLFLPVCLPASATNSQMQKDRLSQHLDSVERVLLFILARSIFNGWP